MSQELSPINDLIPRYIQGEASESEAKALFDWITSDAEHAKQFARAAVLHSQLREQFSGEIQARESGELDLRSLHRRTSVDSASTGPSSRSRGTVTRRRAALLAVSLVACCLVALFPLIFPAEVEQAVVDAPEPRGEFATIVQMVDVDWLDESEVDHVIGDRVAASSFQLERGMIRFRIDSGVEVTLEGPADFEVVSPDVALFRRGLLTSTVPPGAEGFRVETPTTKVVDLGTAFGIRLDESGVPEVSVFDGQVEVGLHSSDTRQLLNEGDSVRVDAETGIETIPIDVSAYEKIWPFSSGIVGSTGAFRFAPPWPRRLRFVRSDSEIFVVPERFVTELVEPLRVNVSTPGEYRNVAKLTPDTIPSATNVRSFVLHYQPKEARPPRLARRITGSITFDQPVLGLILLHDELRDSALRFSPRRAGEAKERRQLELNDRPIGDRVTLSPDRRTVTLNLSSPNETSDLLRVIVDASGFQ